MEDAIQELLQSLHDAGKAVLDLGEGQHSLAQEIEAHEALASAVAAAADVLPKPRHRR